jgi:sec-independent protein translocase protein TatC
MKMQQKRRHQKKPTTTQQHKPVDQRRPFVEHLLELRKRAFIVAGSVLVFSTAAYFVQQSLVGWLLKPSHGQHFIYTSPAGGIGFLFQICTYVGIVLSLPVLLYQTLRFIEPIINEQVKRFVLRSAAWSAILAALGIGFGYVIGLPLALHFLGHQFTTKQITPLLTINEYMSFVTVYLLGSAMLFQLPLIMYVGNRIKPIKPSTLFKAERIVIVSAFVISMLMAPTINVVDQLIIALPILVAYQIGIAIIWYANRKPKRPAKVSSLIEKDHQVQRERIAEVSRPKPIPVRMVASEVQKPLPAPIVAPRVVKRPLPAQRDPSMRKYTTTPTPTYAESRLNKYTQPMNNALVMR